MAKEDLKLRVTSNAPLTTKGSALTWAELDANWINIYNAFVALSQSSYVAAYDNAVEYDDTINNYVTYSSQIWKFINSTPATNVTPTEGATWTKVYATDLVNRPLQIDGVKRYKALISQNAPIAAQTSGTFLVGMIVSTTTYVAGDDFSNWTLVSGTVNTTGAVYQVTIASPTTWSNGSTLAYDGRPYIVSTDVNGDFNPSVNTTGDNFTISYDATGRFNFNHPTIVFDKSKSFLSLDLKKIAQSYYTNDFDGSNEFKIYTYNSSGVATNNILNYTPIEIEVYP